ncbi:MAG: glycosyltransferase family 4 protein [Holophagaceae bacterium]|nr:glycosyltransferase family 4 protein [Holophagaceae bacterium]
MQPLEHLVFNFLPIHPAESGGIATVCQTMARHIPAAAGAARTWVLTGTEDWEAHFPLEGGFTRMIYGKEAQRSAGFDLERRMLPMDPGRSWRHGLARLLGRRSAFPPALAQRALVHCPYQILHPRPPKHWALPYVINLHDVQHEHFPEFFTPKDLQRRRRHYLASARAASAVCVVDAWTKRDVLAHLDIPEAKVFVAPFGPTWTEAPEPTEEDLRALRQRHGLPEAFAFYPAQTWPHKNHLRLLEALAVLKRSGLVVPLVATGHQNAHFKAIQARALELDLADQLHFLGMVPLPNVQALYRAARLTVIPTLFEGGPGIPVLEAMALGSPLAASTACGIPEAVGDGGLLFDGLDVADMAGALRRLWTDGDLREEMVTKARARSAARTWERAARTYVDIYGEARGRWLRDHGDRP